MENASKALIMAAEVLVGVMIISIAVFLFNEFAKYSLETSKKIEDTQIAQFNEQFFKYYGMVPRYNDSTGEEVIEQKKATIHDIVGLANLAWKINVQYGLEDEVKIGGNYFNNNSSYVQIDFKDKKAIENPKERVDFIKLIKENDINSRTIEIKYFKCVLCDINPNTKTVNHVKFVDY